MTTDRMLKLLERGQRVPGTIIQRTLSVGGGLEWTVGVGEMQSRKEYREGATIRAALIQFPVVQRAMRARSVRGGGSPASTKTFIQHSDLVFAAGGDAACD
jgi:hypothetical protein